MMAGVLLHVLLTVLLSEAFGSPVSAGEDPPSSCPPQWLPFGQRCFAFYPVWSSWSTATTSCSQTGSRLVSLHTPEEKQFMRLLANGRSPAWLGGYQEQSGSWFWSDNSPFSISGLIDQRRGETIEGGVCLEMAPKSGGLHAAPCEELRFYTCSIKANSSYAAVQDKADLAPGVSLFDLMWIQSHLLPESILRSSNFLRDLRSGNLTERCYNSFIQQEALYLHRVSSTLEVLISRLQEADDMKLLLMDAFKRYSNRNQKLPPPIAPRWLRDSLQTFHSVVFKQPVYWLVALSARARLHSFLAEELHLDKLGPGPQQGSGSVADSFYRDWSKDNQGEVAWTRRFKEVMEKHQNKMDTDEAIDIFRQHMMNQKYFYKNADCDDETHG